MTTAFEELTPVESSFVSAALSPGEKVPCRECGKVYTVTNAGTIRSHKCVNDVSSTRTTSNRAKKKAPANVYRLAVAAGEGLTEYGTARYLERTIPTTIDRAKQASKLSNIDGGSDAMFGPIVNALWPELPKGAQKTLAAIADHEDLIACAFAWADYFAFIRAFAVAEMSRNEESDGGDYNGIPGEAIAGQQPFVPVVVAE